MLNKKFKTLLIYGTLLFSLSFPLVGYVYADECKSYTTFHDSVYQTHKDKNLDLTEITLDHDKSHKITDTLTHHANGAVTPPDYDHLVMIRNIAATMVVLVDKDQKCVIGAAAFDNERLRQFVGEALGSI